jgi:hypothetical protein
MVAFRMSLQLEPAGAHAAQAAEYLDVIEREGQGRLDLADVLRSQKKYLLAYDQLKSVADEFAGSAAGAEAQRRLDVLAQDPDYVKARREAEAKALLDRARADEQDQKYDLASAGYERVVGLYGETDVAAAARTRLAELRADPRLRALIEQQKADREAATWFDLAENYRRNAERTTGAQRAQLADRARTYYNRILSTYPKSPLAEKARAGLTMLDELK